MSSPSINSTVNKQWFFDKGKTDDNILFIDTRNIFTQIDRAHREFSDEQIQNIAIISRLHKGRRREFVELVDRYFGFVDGYLTENRKHVEPVAAKLAEVLGDTPVRTGSFSDWVPADIISDFVASWSSYADLQKAFLAYRDGFSPDDEVDDINRHQRKLRDLYEPFFSGLHDGLKQLDKVVRAHEKVLVEKAEATGKRSAVDRETKALKSAIDEFHNEVKQCEVYFRHISWLQDRFPEAKYEDVTGLCKLATPAEIREQDYSLNPGRYVGVVIEEDGKTEEEFLNEITSLHSELNSLGNDSRVLEATISRNLAAIAGDFV